MFKVWLFEIENKDYNFYKNVLLGKLNLDRVNGLSQSLDAWEPDQLIDSLSGLGEFKQLSQEIQDQVIGQIRSRMGTLGDLIRLMSSSPTIGDNG